MFSIFTDAAVRGRESPENIGHLSAELTECDCCVKPMMEL